jgi:dTDP-glucose 4,6-dehydratase/UDP-N-acetylglucosamine 2-epimerase
MNNKNILICFGTRPEYIKVKSLIDNLPNIKTCFTGQHHDLLQNINSDYKLSININISNNRLNNIFANILMNTHIFNDIEYVLVQGDTCSACAMALSAFNHQIKIIHLEAGLRSQNLKNPFPEEMNRQVISRLADIHLCPTNFNKYNLLKENISGKIYVVGNTGLDNISREGCKYNNKVLITLHRRDNHHNMDEWFQELEKIANKYSDIEFMIPLHPNSNIQKHKHIFKKVNVVDPMSHTNLIEYIKKCKFVISDSGGIQEECSYLNKKVIICRKNTDRSESLGIHSFMCSEPKLLEKLIDKFNIDYEIDAECPFGNGNSWKNIFSIFNIKEPKMKVLLYGSKGWVGGQFKKILDSNNIECICGTSRVDNNETLLDEITNTQPTHVVSFIGRTHGIIGEKKYTTIDYLEQEGKLLENVRDNLYGPLLLSELCKKNDIHFTYLGTGCIFKFDEDHPFGQEENGFNENSLPNFYGSSYSIVKGFTDRLMKFYDKNVLNLRIRMPITGEQNSRNFITKITTYEKVCSVPNSMTILPELLPYVLDMMKMKKTGTINLTNPGLITHNEIMNMFKEIVDPNFTYKNFSVEEQRSILAADRSNNYLDTTKLEGLFPQVKHIKDSVRNMLVEYKNSYVPKIIVPEMPFDIENEVDTIKTLFITGGSGFIGSNFINMFAKKYPMVKIINFDALYYCANKDNVDKEIQNSDNYVFIEGNLQSFDLLKYVFTENEISHIIHFAAQSHVQNSFTDSIQYTMDNIVGTHNLLEINRLFNKHLLKFIHVSTDEVYGESMLDVNENHKTEQSILCPTNPYAATKASAELLAQSYNHSFNMPIIITRGNNVYGPNQYPEKLIPRFIMLLKENKKVTIQGDGKCVRAFLHAYDTASAFETILLKGKIGEIYNIGCNEGMEYSVLDIAKKLIKLIKNTENYDKWIEYIEDRPFNDQRYYISNNKVKDLGWGITVEFDDELKKLV